MKDILVNTGDTINGGTNIATMENSGAVSPTPTAGTHLHLSIFKGLPKDDKTINPDEIFGNRK